MSPRLPLVLLVFFVLAFALTWGLDQLPSLAIGGVNLRLVLAGWGPLVSGVICYALFRTPNTERLSWWGHRPGVALGVVVAAVALPLALNHQVAASVLLASMVTQFLYSVGEEFGWRHYLQNLSSTWPRWVHALGVGTLWFSWHFAFVDQPVRVLTGQDLPLAIGAPLAIAALSLLTWLWGDLTRKSRSLAIPTTLHALSKYADPVSLAVLYSAVLVLHALWKKIGLGTNTQP